MRIGPLSLSYQAGKPYFVDGYQLEPTAWVLRGAGAGVMVPGDRPARYRFWSAALVVPEAVRVTDPLGRRYTLGLHKRPRGTALLMGLMLLAVVLLWRRAGGMRGRGG